MSNIETLKVHNEHLLKNINKHHVHNKRFRSLVGEQIGNIDVISEVGAIYKDYKNSSNAQTIYLCKCNACGEYSYLSNISLYNGMKRGQLACGCLSSSNKIRTHHSQELIYHNHNDKNKDYRLSKTLYMIFKSIQNRSHKTMIDDKWNGYDKFDNFYNWAIENGYVLNKSRITRNSRNSAYGPNSCKITHDFIYYEKYAYIVYNIYVYKLVEWAEMLNITMKALHKRICEYNWPLEYALLCPNQNKYCGEQYEIEELITPEWKTKNRYEEFKQLGLID